ncbi:MAG: VOC family protein [Pseudorhodoplanes sp.]|nr:VOC family protein [Pseudorhodoplanes sp.]
MTVSFDTTVPVLRIFSVEKAREFYVDYLGFTIDWEHRFEDGMPLYLQVSRNGLTLHLSEHHGDGTPGSVTFVRMSGLDEFHREISARGYRYLRPGIEDVPWNARMMQVIDPFGNRIRFNEYKA